MMSKKLTKRSFWSLSNVILFMIANGVITVASENQEGSEPSPPTFTNVSVHDPSVIKVEDQYYVFGSHLAVAKTTDLMNWDLVHSHVVDDNPIIPNIFEALAAVFEWAQTDTLWAADVTLLNDGRYYLYYNACEGSSPRSAMGVAVADQIEGPYEDLGIFLKSGMWGSASPDGQIYDPNFHPNAVDPHVFYDQEGKLWMVYGSYSGGIFILEMDEATAKPLAGQGYGKQLFGGQHLRVEGAYMLYSETTDYYYLFVSYGGLGAGDGYNLRVSRSRAPDGDFQDITGQHMRDMEARPGVMFDDAALVNYGNKLIGDFRFTNLNGSSTFVEYGYLSPGHNSAYYDAANGKYYNIFHTRFPDQGESHEVRVHQMFMNQDGWFVSAPHRYTGETLSSVTIEAVVGGYHYLNHGKGITDALAESVYVELNEEGTLSGAVEGTWELIEDYDVSLTIMEADGAPTVYNGVFIEQWDSTQQQFVMTFTALSEKGISIWGSGLEPLTNEDLFNNTISNFSFPRTGILYEDLDLPTKGFQEVEISWMSSNETVLAADGTVNRPSLRVGDANVTLTATLTKNQESQTVDFEFIVRAQPEDSLQDGLIAYYDFNGTYEDQMNLNPAALPLGDRIDRPGTSLLPFVEGVMGDEAVYFSGNGGLLLPIETMNQADRYTMSLWIKPEVLTEHIPALFVATDEYNWLSLVPRAWDQQLMLWSRTVNEHEESWFDGMTQVSMEAGEWTHASFTYNQGEIAIYVDGIKRFNGSQFGDFFATNQVKIALGVNYWDTSFQGTIDELRIYERVLKEAELYQLATQQTEESEKPQPPIEADTEIALIRQELAEWLQSIKLNQLNENHYPEALWQIFKQAYQFAELVLANSEDLVELQESLAILKDAYHQLLAEKHPEEPDPPQEDNHELATIRQQLAAWLQTIKLDELNEHDYPEALWQTFNEAYQFAKTLLANSEDLVELQESLAILKDAYDQLLAEKRPEEPAPPLEENHELATIRQQLATWLQIIRLDELNEHDYPEALWQTFNEAYQFAKTLLANSDDLTELEKALETLKEAYEALLAEKLAEAFLPLAASEKSQEPELPRAPEQGNDQKRLPQTGSKQSTMMTGLLLLISSCLPLLDKKIKHLSSK